MAGAVTLGSELALGAGAEDLRGCALLVLAAFLAGMAIGALVWHWLA